MGNFPDLPTAEVAMPASSELVALCQETKTTFVLTMFVDLIGKPCAKLVPVEAVGQLSSDGVGFAGHAVGAMGQTPKDPDLIAIPDPASFTPVPFVKPGLAIVHCDPYVDGQPWPFAPRNILKMMLDQVNDGGLEAHIGAEVEYFLLKRGPDGALTTADADDTAERPCYDARAVTRMYDHLASISCAMNALGWGNYANDHEDANGQFEQNFNYADALTTSDRIITLRYLLSVLAMERGMISTFMPKPFADRTGNGLHFHLSLTSAGIPIFPGTEDPRGLGLSAAAYGFIGGILEHAAALQAILAPTVNSYKRTGSVSTVSGASWAPTAATYGGNDRSQYVRLPDDQRIELRGGDGAANPYLAVAAALGAGMDGMKRSVDPGPVGAAAPKRSQLPMTLLQAVERFESDSVVTGVLDAAPLVAANIPARVSEYYADLKRKEFFTWHSTVSPWEIDTYLTTF